MKDSKDFFSKYDQIRRKLRIGPHLLKKSYSGWAFSWLLTDEGEGVSRKKICYTYPTIMKFGTVIPYLKKTEKMYQSRDTPLEFCRNQDCFIGNQQILLYQKIQI